MLKVLAGDLSATFNLDGGHLQRYLQQQTRIAQSLCEQLLLHDQILIPASDYLAAAGLVLLFGERAVISLLEADQLRFVRLRGLFGFARGEGQDGGLVTFQDPLGQRPQDSSVETSIDAALSLIAEKITDREKLKQLLLKNTHALELSQVIDIVRDDTISELRHCALWRSRFEYKHGLLKLPKMEKMQVRVLGPDTDSANNVVDAFLALALMNVEIYLANQFGCASTSTASPIGDSLNLKTKRLHLEHPARDRVWSFLEIASVPNLAALTLSDTQKFSDLLALTRNRNAKVFREWFHSTANLSEKQVFAGYIDLLHEIPWVQKAPVKAIRFVLTTAADLCDQSGITGKLAGAFDTFAVDSLFKGRSAKYFVEDLRTFSGKIGVKK